MGVHRQRMEQQDIDSKSSYKWLVDGRVNAATEVLA